MKHTLILGMILLSSSLVLGKSHDENYTQMMPSTNDADTSGSASSTETIRVEGCLRHTGYQDFVLTDASGLRYYMNGHRKKLAHMVGQEVRIAGIASPSRNPSTPGAISAASSPEGIPPHITVIKVHSMSNVCQASPRRQ